jgi:hypothetical protein
MQLYYDLREANLRKPTTVTDGKREETATWRDERRGGGTNDGVELLMDRGRDP